jgi:hypothetical protein
MQIPARRGGIRRIKLVKEEEIHEARADFLEG